MKRKNLLLMAGIVAFSFVSYNAFAVEDEWSDYDPCGWNVEQEGVGNEVAMVLEDQWTDYDPCGWNVEQEGVGNEVAMVLEDQWTDYDPCGWNVEQEGVDAEVAKAFIADSKFSGYMN